MYGDEEAGIPPEEIHDREDAAEALQWAREVAETILKLYNELASGNTS